MFRGREDVYAVRWEGRSGKTGYSPAGIREWDQAGSAGRGQKRAFRHSKLFALSEEVIRDHLLGKQTIGVYPLLQDDTCWFVAVDFDKKAWEVDACALLKMCQETGVPASLERSRSGNGGHVWIFFASPIQAALARKLASAVLTRTMDEKLTQPEQVVHFVAITLIAIAVAIIMTPAALHRGTGSRKVTATFVNLSARLLFWSMLPLALGICLDFYLIARVIINRRWVVMLTFVLFLIFMTLWFVLPRARALQRAMSRTDQ